MMLFSVRFHVCVENSPHDATFRACCALEPNITFVRMRALCVCACVCIFCTFLKCTSFQHSQYSVVGFFFFYFFFLVRRNMQP